MYRLCRQMQWLGGVVLAACGMAELPAQGGGSGLNTVVVVNQGSSNSVEVGNYFCERRQVPPENLLRILWTGGNISWSSSDFQTNLFQPLLQMLGSRQLSNQIDYVVLSMDIPFQTANGATINSTTSALFYGLKPDPVYGSQGLTNSYGLSEAPFRQSPPVTAPGYSFLATMLTANSVSQAKQIIDQGVLGDRTFPSQPVVLEKTSDPARNIRFAAFDSAIFDTRILGNSSVTRTNSDSAPWPTPVMGLETGLANFSLSSNTFVPGSIADSFSSYGGVIFGPNDQTSVLELLGTGAAGSYGTVAEPFTDVLKFPSPEVYFYQARGFTVAEAYYQSVRTPYLGLIVGEPLSAPFAAGAAGRWLGASSNDVLRGTAPLSVRFGTAGTDHPLHQIDLFIDGKFAQTLTNLPPRAGNVLMATINGLPITYTVPPNDTAGSVASNLVMLLNDPGVTNFTKTVALAHGDRIELRNFSSTPAWDTSFCVDWSATNALGRTYRFTYLPEPETPQIQVIGRQPDGSMELRGDSMPGVPSTIEASTNLTDWVAIAANVNGGRLDFIDADARNFASRFYRAVAPDKHPVLAVSLNGTGDTALVHADSRTALPFVIETSPDLANWSALATNPAGGSFDLAVPMCGTACAAFFRTTLLPQSPPAANVTPIASVLTNGLLLQVTGAARPYVVEVSTNLNQWTGIFTNLDPGHAQVAVSSAVGTADLASTFLSANRSAFVDSTASGLRSFWIDGTVQTGSWLQVTLTKLTGEQVSVGVTNEVVGAAVADLASSLFGTINCAPELQGMDGLTAEDFVTNMFGQATFHIRARSGGYAAASVRVQITGDQNLVVDPVGPVALEQNLADLQPRNHLYVRSGAATLTASFGLDTTTLSDGFHELTAVAYEGTSVRTQSRVTLPVRIQNSGLSATLTSTDLLDVVSVQGTYHLGVAANTNTISTVRLFSTGGELARIDGVQNPIFVVNGSDLGAGLHPFYAVVQTADGLMYRTDKRWTRLVNGP